MSVEFPPKMCRIKTNEKTVPISKVCFGGDEYGYYLDCGDGNKSVHFPTQSHQIAYINYLSLFVYQFYLNRARRKRTNTILFKEGL